MRMRAVPVALVLLAVVALPCRPALAGDLPVVREVAKISAGSGGFPGVIPARASFGWGLAGLGDLDGDGAPTLAIGAHFDAVFAERGGVLWLADLGRDGSVGAARRLGAGSDGFVARLRPHDGFGLAVAALGDLDGDGTVEVAVSAPGDGDVGAQGGAVYVVSLDRDARLVARRKISPRRAWARTEPWRSLLPAWVQGGFEGEVLPGDFFGASLANVGDLDGDGLPELAVGVRGVNPERKLRGAVWILFLRADATVRHAVRLTAGEGGFPAPLAEDDNFGLALAGLGDLDGDGVPDLAVGAPGDDACGDACGAVHLLFLRADGTVRDSRRIDRLGGDAGGIGPGSEFGIALEALPDLDGDGIGDLAVGARGDDARGAFTGAVWLLSLSRSGAVLDQRRITAGHGGMTADLEAEDAFGSGLALVGDLDGDGWPELAAGAEGDDDGGVQAGAVWILFLGPR